MVIVNNKEITATYVMIFTYMKNISLNKLYLDGKKDYKWAIYEIHYFMNHYFMNYGGNANHIMVGHDHIRCWEPHFCRRVFVIIIFRPKQKTVS